MQDSGVPVNHEQFEQSAEAAFRLNVAGELQQVTTGFANLLRQTATALVGRHLEELLLAAAPETVRQQLNRAGAGAIVSFEAQVRSVSPPEHYNFTLLSLPGGLGLAGVAKRLVPVSAADALLLERERHLSIIFDNIADVTFVLRAETGSRFRFVFVNKAFEQTTGLPAMQVMGRLASEIIPEPALSEVLEYYKTALHTRQPVAWQETSDYPNGRKTGEVRVTPVVEADGTCCQLVGIVHDLTPQKEAEIRLQVSNERFHYALKATTDAIYDWNIAADTLYWGEGFEELFGHKLTENPTPFNIWANYVEPTEHDRVVAGLRHTAFATSNLFWQQEYRFSRADGSWAVVFDRGYILRDNQGRAIRMIGAMQDITARKEAEDQQRLLADKLGRQNADLQQFTYIVSHNLRAPLANALGYADLLSRVEKASPVFDESLRNLRTSLNLLDGVLTDINGILSIRDQQGSYRPEPVALAEVCRQALHSLAHQLQECGGELQYVIPEELRVPGSRAYFHSIFHNLISNAIKYRSDVRVLQISIEATGSSSGSVQIIVEDNGLGFDQKKIGGDIFQLYRRFHPDKPGRGIGLFLVKSHVESMHGRISVQSQLGVGTQFTLLF